MNTKVARRLRREVYGDGSKQNDSRYVVAVLSKAKTGGIICAGTRRAYLKKKKAQARVTPPGPWRPRTRRDRRRMNALQRSRPNA